MTGPLVDPPVDRWLSVLVTMLGLLCFVPTVREGWSHLRAAWSRRRRPSPPAGTR